jgi:type I restriction enzyme R subunit/putative DNA methylase
MDRLLDTAVCGPLHLRRPEIATVRPRVEIARSTHSLKRFLARRANAILGMTGQPFWQDESFDRLVRDRTEVERIVDYIECNPVSAGLVAAPEDFP